MHFVDTYLEEMKNTKSDLTIKNHKSTLKKFSNFIDPVTDPAAVLGRDVMRFKKEMLETGKATTVNTQIKRIKMFFSWCVDRGHIADSPAEDIKLVSEAETVPKWLTEDQRDKLIRAVKKDGVGTHLAENKRSYRNYAIVMLMLQTGIRLQELIDLKWRDVDLGERKGSVLIKGKFGQQREISLVSDAAKVLRNYKHYDGMKGKYVFYSQMSDQISSRQVQTMIKEYSEAVGTDLTPHMLRHTFAHDLISGGMQLEAVARQMGHIKRDGTPNIAQTIRYTKASQSEIDDQMENILAIG